MATERQPDEELAPKSQHGEIAAEPTPPPGDDSAKSVTDVPPLPKKLTAAEQMALYEADLKENDWGHQPC
jgi:hypothetical protein